MSLWLNGRSGNRGACSQPCRSSYNLENSDGKELIHDEHLLSLKDFSAAQHLESMIAAGITSFKIEGRLKDISYVKNVTAYYRQLLDRIIEGHKDLKQESSGKTRFFFTPDLERTFNRGFTDYFLVERKKMASTHTQKSLGKQIAKVISCKGNRLTLKNIEPLTAGDGLCFFNDDNKLEGFLVNQVNGNNILANKPLSVKPATLLWRNNDFAFGKQLQGKTSERKISVSMILTETVSGIRLKVIDEDGCETTTNINCEKTLANNQERAKENLETQLAKLGSTAFELTKVDNRLTQQLFLPSSVINELRRKAIEQLEKVRMEQFRPKATPLVPNELPYYENKLSPLANVTNSKAELFYRRHQVDSIEPGMDITIPHSPVPLMTCKYCLRFEMGQCLKKKNNKEVRQDWLGELFLTNNSNRFRLHFDCQRCEMQIFPTN